MSAIDKVERSAIFSPDRLFRYELRRAWNHALPVAMFVGLNPSTADETQDDPTVRRCMRFAKDWGYGSLLMTNLFAYRATDPRTLRTVLYPIGSENDDYLRAGALEAALVVAAWGVHGDIQDRAEEVVDEGLLGNYTVLGLTKNGSPKHPLYLPATSRPLNPQTLRPVEVTSRRRDPDVRSS